jgi:hypothetical protein
MLYLEDFAGVALDVVRDGMTVGRAEDQALEDEHVQGALEEIALKGRSAGLGHELNLLP